jgi:hypothetical protein
MTKETKNKKSKAGSYKVKSQKPVYNAGEEKRASRRERKVLLPPKRGTVSRAVIRKAVKEIIKERSNH